MRRIDYLSLRLLVERSTGGSPFKKRREIEKLGRAWRAVALRLPPDEEARHKWWRCEARFMLGDYSDWSGWEFQSDYHAGLWHWKDSYGGKSNNPFPIPRWNGTRVKKLWIIGDQGVGDEVFFGSCIPDVQRMVDSVILECDPRLQKAFERSFGCETRKAEIDGKTRKVQKVPEGCDAWWPLGDLPRNFRRSLKSFPNGPYLTADPVQVERFKEFEGKVGISWRGAQGHESRIRDAYPDAVSLQYDLEWTEDVVAPPVDLRNDIEGVLGLLANLSKVVTVSTSVAHFAGALGRPLDVIIAAPETALADRRSILPWKWICGDNGRTPWYPTARVWSSWARYNNRARSKPSG